MMNILLTALFGFAGLISIIIMCDVADCRTDGILGAIIQTFLTAVFASVAGVMFVIAALV